MTSTFSRQEEKIKKAQHVFELRKAQHELGKAVRKYEIKTSSLARTCNTSDSRMKYCLDGECTMPLEFIAKIEKLEIFKVSADLRKLLDNVKYLIKKGE